MKNKSFKMLGLLMVFLCLVFAVSCSEVLKDELVEVEFSSSEDTAGGGGSRMVTSVELDPAYKPDVLFWTYTAEKLDGLYETGSCTTPTKVDDSAQDGRGLYGFPKRFSVDKWKFTVKGYTDKGHTATNLVYSSTREVTLDKSSGRQTVCFVLTDETKAPKANSAALKIQDLYLVLPEETQFAAGSKVKLTMKDTTTDKVIVNGAETSFPSSGAYYSGEMTALNIGTVSNNTGLAAGNHVIRIQIDYDPDGTGTAETYHMIMVGKVNVSLKNGCTTTISGDISNYLARLFPIGGVVYYIHPDSFPMTSGAVSEVIKGNRYGEVSVGGFTYTFYNSSGEPVDLRNGTANSSYQIEFCEVPFGASVAMPLSVGKPTDATLPTKAASVIYQINSKAGVNGYYSVSGTPTCDRFFVSRNVWYKYVGYADDDKVLPAINAVDVGSGKAATALAMNSANRSKTMVKMTTSTWGGVTYGIMCWVDYVNNGTAYSDASFAGDTPVRQFDCSDWYVPSVMELEAMYRSNLFSGSVSGYSNIFTSDKIIMSVCTDKRTQSLGRISSYAYISSHTTKGDWTGTLIRSF